MAFSHLRPEEPEIFEIFCLIWLDSINDMKEIRKTEKKFRSIINRLKRFDDVKQCQEYIEQTSQKDRLVLVVSGRFGREIVPIIHQFRQVISIYVYCMDRQSNEQWASKYAKVKGVVVELNELLSRLSEDQKIQKQIEEPLTINIFATNAGAGQSTIGMNGQFVFFQILIDCLLRLKSSQIDLDELIERCQNEYKGNRVELTTVEQFETEYSSNKVLWWYTRESFFYKILNAALQTLNIHMIFLFRSYISDLHHQLEKYQSKQRLEVYRSQMMSRDELQILKDSIGQFISVNSFFSTSTNYRKVLSFLDISSSSQHLNRILFQIDADPTKVTSKPFADISQQSEFAEESEVLFMLGSIFRLEEIQQNEDDIWIVRMTLCPDDVHGLKQVLISMKLQLGQGETTLATLGKVLRKMGKFDLAEKYYQRLLNELPLDHPSRARIYEDLAKLASVREDYDTMLKWQQKALDFKNEHQLFNDDNPYHANDSLGKSNPILSYSGVMINTKWKQNGMTVAGGNGKGNQLNQFSHPCGICIDHDIYNSSIYISEWGNQRIVRWKCGKKSGQVLAGGNGRGNRLEQLDKPADIIFDQNNDSLIICDHGNKRIVQYSSQNQTDGQIIISDIHCFGLTMDNNGELYVSDWKKNEIRRWKLGETNGILVAGGNGQGDKLNQLNCPTYIFVDDDYSVYISDCDNSRVIKWMKGAKEGIVVAGGQGQGNSLTQLSDPQGITVDHFGNIYVADSSNHRIMRWSPGSLQGTIILGGNGQGDQPNQFNELRGLAFDRQGNLYVVDLNNHRLQKFDIDSN